MAGMNRAMSNCTPFMKKQAKHDAKMEARRQAAAAAKAEEENKEEEPKE